MKKTISNPFFLLLISLNIFASRFSQVAVSQTVSVKRVVARNTITGKVVGVSDGKTISVMRGCRAVKARLHGIDCQGEK